MQLATLLKETVTTDRRDKDEQTDNRFQIAR